MGYKKSYRLLFSIQILHHYFLDEGLRIYGVDLTADRAEINLNHFELSSFMLIKPTERTRLLLKNMRSVFVQNSHGIEVRTSTDPIDSNLPFIEFEQDCYMDFTCELTDSYFENYTDMRINRDKIIFISNKTPLASESDLATTVRFSTFSEFDTSTINALPTPPQDDIKIMLDDFTESEKRGKLALLRIHLIGDEEEMNLTNGTFDDEGIVTFQDNLIKFNSTSPTESITFKNRATIWTYHRTSDGLPIFSSITEIPLTKNGYVTINNGLTDLPNPDIHLIYRGEDLNYLDQNGNLVTFGQSKTYSKIFI